MFRRRNCSAEKLSGLSDSFAAQTCIVVKVLKAKVHRRTKQPSFLRQGWLLYSHILKYKFQDKENENVVRALANSLKGSIHLRAVWNAPKEIKLPLAVQRIFPYATITDSDYRSQRQTDMSVICNTVLNNHRKDYKVIKQ